MLSHFPFSVSISILRSVTSPSADPSFHLTEILSPTGQPVPVVTCGHGTAYGRAGQGRASTTSFENAVRMTARMVEARRAAK